MAKNSTHTGFSNRHGEILEALPAEHAFAFTFRKLYYLIRQSDLEVFCRLIPSWLSILPACAKLGLIARLVYSRACSQLHPPTALSPCTLILVCAFFGLIRRLHNCRHTKQRSCMCATRHPFWRRQLKRKNLDKKGNWLANNFEDSSVNCHSGGNICFCRFPTSASYYWEKIKITMVRLVQVVDVAFFGKLKESHPLQVLKVYLTK